MNLAALQEFQEQLHEYYRSHGRHDLPWRLPEADGSFDPYKILVSEVMLQQTQVPRVIPKYLAFLQQFPSVAALAAAPLKDVLVAWQGLGYNRRAKYLWQAAQTVMNERGGVFPRDQAELTKLPGIGSNTAGAIAAYAFNQPVLFVETNIRTVYIHHFFKDQLGVADADILELLDATLDRKHPRECYWALMDYGSYLKQAVGNLSRASKTYAKQSAFAGSARQLRGRALRLLAHKPLSERELLEQLADDRAGQVLQNLEAEQLIVRRGRHYDLP